MSQCPKKNKKNYTEKKLNTAPSPVRSLCPSPVCRAMKEFQGSLLTSSIPTKTGPESSPHGGAGARSSERPSGPPRPGANQPCRTDPGDAQYSCTVPALWSTAAFSILSQGVITPKSMTLRYRKEK